VQRLGVRIRTNRRQRLPYLLALATLAQWDGETREVLASLQEAAVLAHEIGLPGELWQIEVALGEVYASSGEREQAHQTFARAIAVVQKLAAKMEDEARHSNFLAEPVVRRVVRTWTSIAMPDSRGHHVQRCSVLLFSFSILMWSHMLQLRKHL
jgi:hypothetical protein